MHRRPPQLLPTWSVSHQACQSVIHYECVVAAQNLIQLQVMIIWRGLHDNATFETMGNMQVPSYGHQAPMYPASQTQLIGPAGYPPQLSQVPPTIQQTFSNTSEWDK